MNKRVHVMRDSVVKITQMLSGKGVQVTQQGISAYVKSDSSGRPIVVNLPYLPDNATDELMDAIQGFLDHEVAHILFTDFNVMKGALLSHCESLYNIVEDARIELCMADRFQGSGLNLSRTGAFYLKHYIEPGLKKATGDENKTIGLLMPALIRSMAGQHVFADYMKDKMHLVSEVYDKINDLESRIQGAKSSADCLEIAKEIHTRLSGEESPSAPSPKEETPPPPSKSKSKKAKKPEEKPEEEKPDEDDAEDGDGDEEDEEEEEEDDSETGDETGEDDESGEDGETEDGETDEGEPDGAADSKAPPTEGVSLSSSSPLLSAIDKESANSFDKALSRVITESVAKASKNSDYLVFTRDQDVVETLKVGKGYDSKMLASMQNDVDHMVAPLQKDLERAIAARSLATFSGGHRSGRLHSANLSRLIVGDTRVFRRKEEAYSKDVAVELVVDASGSMSGGKIHCAAQAAYALASVLERINIKCEVICFTTGESSSSSFPKAREESKEHGVRYSRSESLYMPVLKGFQERMSIAVKDRFAWLPNCGFLANNVDGESIEIAARRLLSRREKGKVMIVLSDGNPSAAGSRSDLEDHLKKVLKDVSSAGIKTVGIGIQSDFVRKYYPKCVVINKIDELPTVVMKELRSMLLD